MYREKHTGRQDSGAGFRVLVLGWIALSSVLGFGFTFWGFGSVPISISSQLGYEDAGGGSGN